MKYSTTTYARALAQALRQAPADRRDKIMSNFISMVKKRNTPEQVRRIFKVAEGVFTRSIGRKKIVIETARPLTGKNLAVAQALFGHGETIIFKINPEVIAGMKITVDEDQTIDGTLARKLKKIFKN